MGVGLVEWTNGGGISGGGQMGVGLVEVDKWGWD